MKDRSHRPYCCPHMKPTPPSPDHLQSMRLLYAAVAPPVIVSAFVHCLGDQEWAYRWFGTALQVAGIAPIYWRLLRWPQIWPRSKPIKPEPIVVSGSMVATVGRATARGYGYIGLNHSPDLGQEERLKNLEVLTERIGNEQTRHVSEIRRLDERISAAGTEVEARLTTLFEERLGTYATQLEAVKTALKDGEMTSRQRTYVLAFWTLMGLIMSTGSVDFRDYYLRLAAQRGVPAVHWSQARLCPPGTATGSSWACGRIKVLN